MKILYRIILAVFMITALVFAMKTCAALPDDPAQHFEDH